MKNTKKKGFTIVELVVVVAVIAILAAVLIPTFSGIIKKARLNADEQTVANMNKYVAAAAAEEEFVFAADAVNALYANGFNMGKFETFSKGYHYAYDFENNRFCLLDKKGEIVFPENSNVEAKNLWGFFNNQKSDKIADAEDKIVVTKYIALSAINDTNLFNAYDCVFAGTTAYTLDLNGKALTVADKDGEKNITLVNGVILDTIESGYTLSNGIAKKTAATPDSVATLTPENGTLTIDGAIFNTVSASKRLDIKAFPAGTTAVVFKNCVFDLSGKNAPLYIGSGCTNITSYTFENCTFSLDAQIARFYGNTNAPSLTIKGCTLSSGRGFNIGENAANASIFSEILIENNTFIDNGTASGKPFIQFPSHSDNNSTFTASKITIKDNEFICKDIAIRIHETVKNMACSNVVISGNKIPDGVIAVDGDNTVQSKAIAAEWAAKIQ